MGWPNPLRNFAPILPFPFKEPAVELLNISNRKLEKICRKSLRAYHAPSKADELRTTTFLRIFLDYLPDDGRRVLSTDIIGTDGDDVALRCLAQYLRDAILKPVKIASGTQPDMLPTYALDAKHHLLRDPGPLLRDLCLRRDGFQCAYRNLLDKHTAECKLGCAPGVKLSHTMCALILPFALGNNVGYMESEVTKHNKVAIWTALQRYFPSLVKNPTKAMESIYTVANALTLDCNLRSKFEGFRLAFLPRSSYAEFDICWLSDPPKDQHISRARNERHTFMRLKFHATNLPNPSREFLEIHYRIACILLYSNIGAAIEHELARNAMLHPRTIQSDGSTDLGNIVQEKLLTHI
ncbi:hypothetical protein Cob_v002364 [Colletotrichum orbiculare MAFF 240422]|uniref:HNH nuclease domain-containing protein n=1 Tax=Colletotrichum orbiculare (strain 104-T / ATCC 96160 / CBS 514.97 / LARS 414 / MAFF 240422) TaxID=1213857 RepID=A0A484G2H9_COLOR|nr:hypothetical protein Cob_v002364 [Colletotrichum orbiculare MAFF 240422]